MRLLGLAVLAALLVVAACGSEVVDPSDARGTSAGSSLPSAGPTERVAQRSPSPAATSERTSKPTAAVLAWTKLERAIRDGIRSDVAYACIPRRDALPRGTVAAVECSPRLAFVERVGFYLFDDGEAALEAYLDRMRREGIELDHVGSKAREHTVNSCSDELENDPECLHDRVAAFLNSQGYANYRAVAGPLYIGVLGTRTDLRELELWAWSIEEWPDWPQPASGDTGVVPWIPTLYDPYGSLLR